MCGCIATVVEIDLHSALPRNKLTIAAHQMTFDCAWQHCLACKAVIASSNDDPDPLHTSISRKRFEPCTGHLPHRIHYSYHLRLRQQFGQFGVKLHLR